MRQSKKQTDKRSNNKRRPAKSGVRYKKTRQAAPQPKQIRPDGAVRLNKAIAQSGAASRREADLLIAAGRVQVNGSLPEMGTFVLPTDAITIDGQPIRKKIKRVYMVLNKPVGIECTTDRRVKDNIIDFIGYPERIFPIGRLDKDSEGLILLTNDGDVVNPILRADNAHEKEYIVTVNKPITDQFIEQMSAGVAILGTVTLPCKVKKIGNNRFVIVLVQGLNRQIRRMTEALGYKVTALKRVRIMNIHLGKLKTGTHRILSREEMAELKRIIDV